LRHPVWQPTPAQHAARPWTTSAASAHSRSTPVSPPTSPWTRSPIGWSWSCTPRSPCPCTCLAPRPTQRSAQRAPPRWASMSDAAEVGRSPEDSTRPFVDTMLARGVRSCCERCSRRVHGRTLEMPRRSVSCCGSSVVPPSWLSCGSSEPRGGRSSGASCPPGATRRSCFRLSTRRHTVEAAHAAECEPTVETPAVMLSPTCASRR
jgi:hypothetical protein